MLFAVWMTESGDGCVLRLGQKQASMTKEWGSVLVTTIAKTLIWRPRIGVQRQKVYIHLTKNDIKGQSD